MDKISDLRRRCCSDSRKFEDWESLRNDIREFLRTATEEEKAEWFSDWAPGETAIMMYEYLQAEREQEEKRGKG